MSDAKPVTSVGGLRGQSAGSTAICTVGKEGIGLTCRGYHIDDLAENATFEEVAYLLLKGTLPNRQELDDFKKRLKRLRSLSPALKEVLERIPKDTQPMESSVRAHQCLARWSRSSISRSRMRLRSGYWQVSPRCFVTGIACSPNAGAAAVLDRLNRLVQAAEALLAGRPDPQTR